MDGYLVDNFLRDEHRIIVRLVLYENALCGIAAVCDNRVMGGCIRLAPFATSCIHDGEYSSFGRKTHVRYSII